MTAGHIPTLSRLPKHLRARPRPAPPGAAVDLPSSYRVLYLLPSAPASLVHDVYQCLWERLREVVTMDPRRRSRLGMLDEAYAAVCARPATNGPRADGPRTPWTLLHIAQDAPADVIEVAYRHWWSRQNARRRGPFATRRFLRALGSLAPAARSRAARLIGRGGSRAGTKALAVQRKGHHPIEAAVARKRAGLAAGVSIRACLVPEPGIGESIAVGNALVRIGSKPRADFIVPVSPAVAAPVEVRIWFRDDRCLLHAVEGGPAVLVNGQPLLWALLEEGDRVQIGEAIFRFRATPQAEG